MTAVVARTARLIAVALACTLTLAGCTTPSAPRTDADAGASPGSADTEASVERTSALQPCLDVLWDFPSTEDFVADKLEIEEEVASCMAERGFPHTPKPAEYYEEEQTAPPTDLEPGSREDTAVNGYGIYRTAEERAAEDAEYARIEESDPNRAYTDSLSEAQRLAYDTALYGFSGEDGQPVGEPGCAAALIGMAEGPPTLEERNKPLTDAIDRLYQETILRDADILKLDAEWSQCMAGQGQPGLSDPEAAFDAVRAIFPDAAQGQIESADEGRIVTARAQEVEIALADFDCRVEVDYDSRYQDATIRLEEEFLAQNRAKLDAMMAEAEQGGGE